MPEGTAAPDAPSFADEFSALLAAKDGNWYGFAFPEGITLPSEVDFPINAPRCRFNGCLTLDKVMFREPVDFSNSVFGSGVTLKNVTFSNAANFAQCRFDGPVHFQQVFFKSVASFPGAEFHGQATFRASFSGLANFNNTIFHDSATFAGWRNITLRVDSSVSFNICGSATISVNGAQPRKLIDIVRSELLRARSWLSQEWAAITRKLRSDMKTLGQKLKGIKRKFATRDPDTTVFRVFDGEAQFQNALFLRLERTVFSQVNLSNVLFLGTNLRGAKFIDATWWQPAFRRNGIRDEEFVRFSNDGPFRYQTLPALEETCRNVRVALEENRSFDKATDFYIGEMDAARLQLGFLRRHIFSVLALYNSVSHYGSNVGVAFRFLVLLILMYLSLTLLLQTPNGSLLSLSDISQTGLASFKTLLFQAGAAGDNRGLVQGWLDAVFRILGVVQATMVTLAFRARTKRH